MIREEIKWEKIRTRGRRAMKYEEKLMQGGSELRRCMEVKRGRRKDRHGRRRGGNFMKKEVMRRR